MSSALCHAIRRGGDPALRVGVLHPTSVAMACRNTSPVTAQTLKTKRHPNPSYEKEA